MLLLPLSLSLLLVFTILQTCKVFKNNITKSNEHKKIYNADNVEHGQMLVSQGTKVRVTVCSRPASLGNVVLSLFPERCESGPKR